MSLAEFRQLYITHTKEQMDIFLNFGFQLRSYFNECVRGMDVATFDELIELLITYQTNQKVPPENG